MLTRTVGSVTVVARLRTWKTKGREEPELKLHGIPKNLSNKLKTALPEELQRLSTHPPTLRFYVGDWFLYIHFEGKVANKKQFVRKCFDFVYDWLSNRKLSAQT